MNMHTDSYIYLFIHLSNSLQNTGGIQVRSENIKFNVSSERQ